MRNSSKNCEEEPHSLESKKLAVNCVQPQQTQVCESFNNREDWSRVDSNDSSQSLRPPVCASFKNCEEWFRIDGDSSKGPDTLVKEETDRQVSICCRTTCG